MEKAQLVIALIGSAAVGALISAIIGELGRWRERKSRREELALAKAIEMTKQFQEKTFEFARMMKGTAVRSPSECELIESFYQEMKHILDHGKLTGEMASKIAEDKDARAAHK